ncbi:sodium:solute symporter family transporter [Phycisphaera mikurensis]|uniref:Putative sodium/solute symporter n=1 Tax=Phycisphaera mikurensis (strain NBRC 102666 / KCTC 22515 / FYK2301M01) TaxID=1142394 RepID=I0IHP9_PHYMF|nr:sodium:solute symporter [Phycisphaera mikurensis]MBB6441032.1 Na+/proline symporter [Phycisphaera mikurensis]BAM04787.1 putative sodium/solute symporter [Phycisphaera mikurensis NBRC 102666]
MSPLAAATGLHGLDVAVLVGYLAGVSWLGVKLAGKSDSAERFFRGGGIPWPAVAASMIATAVSAVTFIAVPAVAFRDGGDFTYLQLGLVAGLLSRLAVAAVLVPAYFREGVLSPYDFMANRLGPEARWVTTLMFSLLGVLGQAARVYLTGVVLVTMCGPPLASAAAAVGVAPLTLAIASVSVVAIAWTLLGGIATVIWTDAMLLAVFVLGGLVALLTVAAGVDGGLAAVVATGLEGGKFRLFDLSLAPEFTRPYTLWAAVIAVTFGNIGSYGTDQLLAQRIFACRSPRDAQKAVLASYLAEAFAALMLLVGVALWAFYEAYPDALPAAAVERPDAIFPAFVLAEVPIGLTGLILAGVFAAALSSLTSILGALAQTTTALLPEPADDASGLRRARFLVALWGVVLALAAVGAGAYVDHQEAAGNEVPLLDLALGLANYVIGGLLAAFVLAWLPLRINARGLLFSAPLSVACVWAARFHGERPAEICLVVGVVFLAAWTAASACGSARLRGPRLRRLPVAAAAAAVPLLLERFLVFGEDPSGPVSIAWPWYAPLAGLVAGVFGYGLADPRTEDPRTPERPRSADLAGPTGPA